MESPFKPDIWRQETVKDEYAKEIAQTFSKLLNVFKRNTPDWEDDAGKSIYITKLGLLPKNSFIDVRALCEILKLTDRTIRRMISRYQIPSGIMIGGRQMWHVGKLLGHLEERCDEKINEARKNRKRLERYMK